MAYNSLGLDFSPHVLAWLSPEVECTSCTTVHGRLTGTRQDGNKKMKREKSLPFSGVSPAQLLCFGVLSVSS